MLSFVANLFRSDKHSHPHSHSHGHQHSHSHGHSHGGGEGKGRITFGDAEQWSKEFEKPERETWQKPNQVIDVVIKPLVDKYLKKESVVEDGKNTVGGKHMITIADIGCGTGYFLSYLVKHFPPSPSSSSSSSSTSTSTSTAPTTPIPPQVQLIGSDIEEGMREYCTKRFQENRNVRIEIPTTTAHAGLSQRAHIMIILNVYHHISDKGSERSAWIKHTFAHDMEPDGTLIIVENKTGELPIRAPPAYMRLSVEDVVKEATEAGVCDDPITYSTLLPYHEVHVINKGKGGVVAVG